MISNLRSRSIEGHIADSAGNILRNAQVVIKQPTPAISFTVDSVQSDDDGYFVSKPLPNGIYDIYESGIRVSRVIHYAVGAGIPCFKADQENFDITRTGQFQSYANATPPTLNQFKAFIQIEPSFVDVSLYGSLFQIYDRSILVNPIPNGDTNELHYIAAFHGFNSNSRITTTRFDVEYFAPLTSLSSTYKRIRWAGVPGIRFYKDSRLVLPLDYFSIVPNLPKTDLSFGTGTIGVTASSGSFFITETAVGVFTNLLADISIGDIAKCQIEDSGKYWYGIVTKISSSGSYNQIELEPWKSSRFPAEEALVSGDFIKRIYLFDGMFSNIMAIDDEANSRFCVTENNSAQNNSTELYNYNNYVL